MNIASIAGIGANPGMPYPYTATKHAVVGLTKQLALEFGPKGVRANVIEVAGRVSGPIVDLPIARLVEIGQEIVDRILGVEPEARVGVNLERGIQHVSIRNHAGTQIAFQQSPLSISASSSAVRRRGSCSRAITRSRVPSGWACRDTDAHAEMAHDNVVRVHDRQGPRLEADAASRRGLAGDRVAAVAGLDQQRGLERDEAADVEDDDPGSLAEHRRAEGAGPVVVEVRDVQHRAAAPAGG